MWLLPILLFSLFMRRRPLARAAVVGGTAYYAGKKVQEGREQDAQTEARLQDLEAQQYAAQAQPAAPAKDPMEQLKELAALRDQGVLTDAEFEIQKTKILQGM